MAKVTLNDIDSLANTASAKEALNENFTAIEQAVDDSLSRVGGAPNAMEAEIDMGEHKILNVADPVAELDAVNLRSVRPLVDRFAGEIAEVLIEGTLRVKPFVATAGQTDFVLDDSPGIAENVQVYDQGIWMEPGVDYTLGGTDLKTISFFTGRALGNRVVARYIQLSPSDSLLRADLNNPATSKGSELVAFTQAGTGATAQNVMRKLKGMMLSILDFVPTSRHDEILDGTSTWDATEAVQAAIDYAIEQRRSLYAPGHYRLTAVINITGSLTLVGDGNEMLVDWLGNVQERGKGSWFFLDHTDRGFFINDSVHRTGITLDSVGTYRTQPDTSGGSFTPSAHGWDIEAKNVDLVLRNITLYNPTQGILSWGGTRIDIDRLRGQPLTTGIDILDAADTCRIRDIHFWPFYSNSVSVRDYMNSFGSAILLKDVDNPDLWGIFTIGYANSIVCMPHPTTAAMPLKVRLSNFDFDNGGYGFRTVAGGAHGTTAILSHGYILGVSVGGPGNASNIQIEGTLDIIMIDNVGMDLPQDCNIKVLGTNNKVRASNLSIGRWNHDGGASTSIEVASSCSMQLTSMPIIHPSAGTGSTHVFGGAGAISCPLSTGVVSATTSPTGVITVAHNTSVIPRVITATCKSGTPYVVYPTGTRSTTTFDVQIRDLAAGSAVASTLVEFEWSAWY